MSQNYAEGNVPMQGDAVRALLVKQLNSLNAGGGGGGGGGSGLVGSGSPQNVTSAAPGTTYFDSVGQAFWVKQTGNGNTGWVELI